MVALANTAQEMNLEITVTAGMDGQHMTGSRHYTGEALDVRSKNFATKGLKAEFLVRVLKRLGMKYQGFLEGEGTANEHFHFEYDPK